MNENCQTIELLLAGYALCALDTEERNQVKAHLEVCTDCQKALSDYQSISEGLLFALPPKEPPAALRARLIKATLPAPVKPGWEVRLRSWMPRLVPLSLIISVLVLLVLNINLLQDTKQLLQAQEIMAKENQAYQTAFSLLTYPDSRVTVVEDDNLYGTLVYDPNDTIAVLTVRGLETLPPDLNYQVWLIEPDQTRTSGGVFNAAVSGGYTSFVIKFPTTIETYIGIGVTIEPQGGSPGPTGARILRAEL